MVTLARLHLLACCTQMIQRRQDGSVRFDNDYAMYEAGFGSAPNEYWFGAYAECCHLRVIVDTNKSIGACGRAV